MKLITKYEVEGCWSSINSKSKCRYCGTKLEEVPKKGHCNSKYWALQRDDGTFLMCCPDGCNLELAENKMREYLKIQYYCTKNSESYNYKLDYKKINNAWIDRKGKIFPCSTREHVDLAYDLDSDERTLEKMGWLKLSNLNFYWEEKTLSQNQINIIFDYMKIYDNNKFEKFKEIIDNKSGHIKVS